MEVNIGAQEDAESLPEMVAVRAELFLRKSHRTWWPL